MLSTIHCPQLIKFKANVFQGTLLMRKNHRNTPSIISHNILRMANGFRNMRHVEFIETRMHMPPALWGT